MEARAAILVADPDPSRRLLLKEWLDGAGCRLLDTGPDRLLHAFESHSPAVVIVGATAATASAVLQMVHCVRRRDRRASVILITSDGSESLAVSALRAGVKDYLKEPLSPGELLACVRAAIASRRPASPASAGPPPFVGASPEIRHLRERIASVAPHDASVLITGETGTGKELVAALLHDGGPRRHHPLISVSCAAIPESLLENELFGHDRGAFTGAAATQAGLLEQARGGTVFLDEVGEMSALAQAKVLRAIETREVTPLGGRRRVPLDVRFIAATNQDPEAAVRTGAFRQDLYFRLNVVRMHLPPLRQRASDVPALLTHYIEHFRQRSGHRLAGFSDDAVSALQHYSWPGNIRELKNLVEAIVADQPRGEVRLHDLPPDFLERLRALSATPDAERDRLLSVLLEARWNKSRAARQLRCSRMTLYRQLARFNLSEPHTNRRR